MQFELNYRFVDELTLANLNEQLQFTESRIAELQSIGIPTPYELKEVAELMSIHDALKKVIKLFS